VFRNTTPVQRAKAVLVLAICLIAYALAHQATNVGKTSVSLTVIPRDAQVSVNDKPTSGRNLFLKPGDYTFTAAKPGWQKYSITLKVGQQHVEVGLIPSPDSDAATNYLLNNPSVQLDRESWGGKNDDLLDAQLTAQTPFIKSLPYNDIYGPFDVSYGQSDSRKFGAFIEVSNTNSYGRRKFLE
jgi:hypothetical protein